MRDRAPWVALPALYWWSTDPGQLPLDELPDSFVLKANNGSGFNLVVGDRQRYPREALVTLLRRWLRSDFTQVGREWAYRNVRRAVYAEERLPGAGSAPPPDYKFFVFGGRLRVIQVDEGRGGRHTQALYDEGWNFFEGTLVAEQGRPGPPPVSLPAMIAAAEALSAGVDFVRVDLYDVGGCAYFGELTNYPNKGMSRFEPRILDRRFGDMLCLDIPSNPGPTVDYPVEIDENGGVPPTNTAPPIQPATPPVRTP